MLRKLFGEPTSDEQLALNLRQAVTQYNKAMDEAISAGLSVGMYNISRWGSKEYMINRFIQIKDVTRTNTEKF